MAIIQQLEALGVDNAGKSILLNLVDNFKAKSPILLVQLRSAVEQGNAHSIEAIAHSLRGACNNLGALRMASFCQTLEDMGRDSNLVGAAGALSQLEPEFAETKAAFDCLSPRNQR